ncbi:MAG: hypothetical protein OEV64_04645 [Desulfobulbaceae bacterium]|nr:hypothetical protein [Desulfobulbaceae bacterium]
MIGTEGKGLDEIQRFEETIRKYGALVTIDKTEGSPPTYFELSYRVPGYVPGLAGQPEISELHRVSIDLPLGYPTTFPLVKPLTPLFHPEVGKEAYGIAMRWHEIGSLSELVTCIGKMICGELFNAESLLNLEAAMWYKDNPQKTKLAIFEPPSAISSELSAILDEIVPDPHTEGGEQEKIPTIADEIDTHPLVANQNIDELTGKEKDASRDVFFEQAGTDKSEEQKQSESQAEIFAREEISSSLGKHKIFTANRLLSSLGKTLPTGEQKKLKETIGKLIIHADVLHKEVIEYEEQGDVKKALAAINRLAGMAADYPGLANLRTRIKQAEQLVQTFSLKGDEEDKGFAVEIIKKTAGDEKNEKDRSQDWRRAKGKKSKTFAWPDLPYGKIATGFFCAALIGVFLFVYFHDTNILKESERGWQRTQDFIAIHEFKKALEMAEEAKTPLADVFMLTGKSKKLALEIENVLISNDFIEGLHGKALYKGSYVEFAKIEFFNHLESMIAAARSFRDAGKFEEAIEQFEKARLFATGKGLESHSRQLQQEINNLRLGEALEEAKSAEGENKWGEAAEIYKKALDVAHSVSEAGSEEEQRMINQYLTVALFRYQLEQSKQIIQGENWGEAVAILSEAEKVLRENPSMISVSEKDEFEQLFNRTRLYYLLSEAKSAYELGAWDKAVETYVQALQLIKSIKKYFGNELDGSEQKIAKTLLMTKVARGLSLAADRENQDDPSGAIVEYDSVIKLLEADSLGENVEFKRVIDNTRLQIAATENRRLVKAKIAWLMDNYGAIFKKHYPTVNENVLLYPEVTLIKKEHDKMVFHISCVEKSHGRPLRLVLDYVNILGSDKWELYAGK